MFKRNNSGTYNSQWIIVDYNRVNQHLKNSGDFSKIIYVLEQTPGRITAHDITDYLVEKGYFASFNRAFFSESKESLNQQLITNLYGGLFDYEGGVRKKLFQTLDKTAFGFEDVQKVLRFNGYKMDGTFGNDGRMYSPAHGISSRFDLLDQGVFSGGIDTKVTDTKRVIEDNSAKVVSGPTTEGNDNLPIFKWKDFEVKDVSREGVPEAFDFKWMDMSPKILEDYGSK